MTGGRALMGRKAPVGGGFVRPMAAFACASAVLLLAASPVSAKSDAKVAGKTAGQRAQSIFIIPTMPGNGFRVDMGTMLDRRFYTVIRQQYDFSCGSAALATLLRYHYGVPADEQMTFSGMWDKGDQEAIRKGGFSLLDMKRYLSASGLETQGFKVTLDQIAQTQVPGIALTITKGYRHFVVIKGVTANEVLVGDPSRGLIRYSRKEFEKIWDGLFFVITSAREVGTSSFNRLAQWTSIGRAPVGSMLSRPLDMQTVRIAATAPVLGEY